MKVLFANTVLDEVLENGSRSMEIRRFLNDCQDKTIEGYCCSFYYCLLAQKMTANEMRKTLSILGKLLKPIHVNMRDLREALNYEDPESGLYAILVKRHRLDCALVMEKNGKEDSTIELYVPKELRRKIENGKTSEQRRDL